MSGRYGGWRRLVGPTAERPDLFDRGKKLLAELDDQRRLSGVKSCVKQVVLDDGSIVRAGFNYDHPFIEVRASQRIARPQSSPVLLDGLIVRPSPAATDQATNAEKNHVLLRPMGDVDWRPHFYDAAAVPEGFEDKHGFYGSVPHLPPLFPEGIGHYGNIDWRNAGESVMVTFHGPESRYFYDPAHSFRSTVYFKGQLLFDLADVEFDLLGLTNGQVRGACLRGVEDIGPCLLVIVRHADTERLLRVPVRRTAAARRAAPDVPWPLATTLESVADDIAVLLTWTPELDGATPYHPWMFNQSGTEARRMTQGAQQSIEEVLLCPDAEDEREYLTVLHDWSAGTRSTHIEYTAVPTPADIVGTDGATTYRRAAITVSELDTVTVYTETITEDFADPWVPMAVDFLDDAAVYAYLRRATETVATSYTRPLLYTRTETGTITYPYHVVCDTDASHTLTATRTTTAVCGGLRTDWLEVEADPVTSTISHSETCDESSSITYDDLAAPSDPSAITITAASGTVDYSYSRTTVTRSAEFVIGYLDLRYRIAMYGRFTELTSKSRAATNSIDLADDIVVADVVGSSGYGLVPLLAGGDITKSVTSYLTAALTVNGVTVWSLGEQQLAPTDTAPEVQADLFAHNATNGFKGNVLRGLSLGVSGLGVYPSVDFTRWVTGTTPPGDTGDYDASSDTTLAVSGEFDLAALGMREAAISGNGSAQTNDYPDTVNNVRFGAWQAYKGRYGYSFTYSANGTLTHAYGLGDLATGVASEQTLPDLTGSLEPRFHPVGVLTPTATP